MLHIEFYTKTVEQSDNSTETALSRITDKILFEMDNDEVT